MDRSNYSESGNCDTVPAERIIVQAARGLIVLAAKLND